MNCNKDLFLAFEKIIEQLNNLNYLKIDLESTTSDDDIVNSCIEKLNNFKYRNIHEMDLNNDIKFITPKRISMEEISKIEEYKKLSFKESLNKENPCNNYSDSDYYISDIDDDYLYIVNFNRDRTLLSLIDNDENSLLEECKNILQRV